MSIRKQKRILKMPVDIINHDDAVARIESWLPSDKSHYVCVSNVHMCMEAWDDEGFEKILCHADLVVPDGRPIFWGQKLLGDKDAQQVRGMDLTHSLCEYANKHKISVGFYGGEQSTLDQLHIELCKRYPDMPIPVLISPPFRALSEEEKQADIHTINTSGIKFLFVGLGCPKQERWMSEHQPHLSCTLLGVGAAFDFIAGNKKHAPKIFQVFGLEWLFRMLCEPKRLWKRYLTTNPRFIWYFLQQLAGKNY